MLTFSQKHYANTIKIITIRAFIEYYLTYARSFMSIDINIIVTEIIDSGREKNQDVCLIGLTHHGLVCVRGVQLHVDLSVDPCFTFLVEVLARLTLRHFFGCC